MNGDSRGRVSPIRPVISTPSANLRKERGNQMVNTRADDLQAIDLASARRTLRAPELVRFLRHCRDTISGWTSADAYERALADGTRAQLLIEADALIAEIMG